MLLRVKIYVFLNLVFLSGVLEPSIKDSQKVTKDNIKDR